MQADFSVELGAADPYLELPWEGEDGRTRYYDLRHHPEQLLEVEEVRRYPELGEFLASINGTNSVLETAKCDAWFSTEISEEEEVFGTVAKFGSYIDLVLREEAARLSLERHEQLARKATELLKRAPEISAGAEFVVRRCYFREDPNAPERHREGFYLTFYLFGYGDDEEDARRRWMIALKVSENALLQLSAEIRRASA